MYLLFYKKMILKNSFFSVVEEGAQKMKRPFYEEESMKTDASEFGWFRSCFFPIHRSELSRLIPMFIMLFLIAVNQSILRNLKDTIVITAKSSGAEVIPFIKVWVMMPMAILFTIIYAYCATRIGQKKVFFGFIIFFISYFFLFGFVFYPARDALHPHQIADWLQEILPAGFQGFIAMFRNWTFTIFYAMCELWGSTVLTVLFWGFANEITSIKQAPRFYTVLGIAGNLAAMVAGTVASALSKNQYSESLPYGHDAWEQTLMSLLLFVFISGVLTLILFQWMTTQTHFREYHEKNASQIKLKKKKMPLKESFAFLLKSKYLLCIAIIVIGYNLSINLAEVMWKDQLKEVYRNPMEYNAYTSNLLIYLGISSTLAAICLPMIINAFGWTVTALIAPLTMLVTSAFFFAAMLFKDSSAPFFLDVFGMTPVMAAVSFGAIQNCMSKAAKYSAFDATKEMAFIPLDPEWRLKGKAAIDGVGSRIGKSGGSFIYQALIMAVNSISQCAPYIAVILFVVIIGWLIAVVSLGRQFNEAYQKEKGQPSIG
ncbi:MAG: ntt4 [Chlamydiales bacterium]|jgi:AAA family ATP:ADP antiporter|nr:ntt4 [Chlamydiales bacterium]